MGDVALNGGCHSPMCQKLQDERYDSQQENNRGTHKDVAQCFELIRGISNKVALIVGVGVGINIVVSWVFHLGR